MRFPMTPIPHPTQTGEGKFVGLDEAFRLTNQNFRQLSNLLERAVLGAAGGLIPSGSITLDLLATATKTLVGDVTGTIGSSGSTAVERIRGKTVDTPAAPEDAKVLAYNHGNSDFDWVDVLRDVLTTRGDLLVRGASAEARLGIGGANTVLKSDGTDPGWQSLSALLDTVFGSAQGSVLYRDSAVWNDLGPGTSGHFLKTQGAGANPVWDSAASGSAHDLLSLTHEDTTAAAVVRGDLITGQGGTPTWTRLPLGSSGQVLTSDGTDAVWDDPPAGTNHDLLSATHDDTVAASPVRGDLIVGNSTPAWERKARGTRRFLLGNDGSDVTWDDPKRFGLPSYYALYSKCSFVYGNAILTGGNPIGAAITSSGTAADDAGALRAATKWTNATTGSIGYRTGGNIQVQSRHNPYARFDVKLNDNVDGCTWMGFLNLAAGSNAADPAVALAAFRARNGTDTNFQAVTHTGAAIGVTDTGVPIDGNWHDFEILTDDAGVTWYFYIDGVLVATRTTNVPGTSTAMQFQVLCNSITSSARDIAASYVQVLLGQRPTV